MSDDLAFDPTKKKKKSSKKAVEDGDVEEVIDATEELDLGIDLKKKKKKKAAVADDEVATAEGDSVDAGEFDFKKKKKKSKSAATSSFDKELEQAGVDDAVVKAPASAGAATSKYSSVNEDGDPDLTYPQLLGRFFEVLREKNPELAGDRSGTRYKIPPPQVMREGNKKTVFANVKDIAQKMDRSTEHVCQFLFAELGTSGSTDGTDRLIIKGRFQQKTLETVLRRYIMEYVTCKTCRSAKTKMEKKDRLYFLECQDCHSRRSVSGIKTGYQAIMRRRDLKKNVG